MAGNLDCQDLRCQAREKPYRAKYFIRSDYCDRKYVCGYHARAWVKAVRERLAESSDQA